MLQHTVSALGFMLKTLFGCPVKYTSADGVFNSLSESNNQLELPVVAFMDTNISLVGMNLNRSGKGPIGGFASTNNAATIFDLKLVTLEFNLALVSSKVNDHFRLLKTYWGILDRSKITIVLRHNGIDYPLDLSISDVQSLSNDYKRRHDYDIGEYHVREGGFKLNSFIVVEKFNPVIREINITSSGETLRTVVKINDNGSWVSDNWSDSELY